MIISFVLLFIVIAVLIQIPAIQTKIVNYATTYVSNKTHTRVDIKKISISFPKSIVIEGIYLEDTRKDTLLCAGLIKVNIAFSYLFNQELYMSSFVLEDLSLNLNRTKTDSLFNYNFLLTAFSDTTKQKKIEPKTKSKWTFSVDNVELKNIHLHYDDNYDGTSVGANLEQLKLKMDEIDLEKSVYRIDELAVENLTATVVIKESGKIKKNKSESVLPLISANKILITNTNFSYVDSVGKQSLVAGIKQLQLVDASADLQKQLVTSGNIYLSKSKINFNRNDTVSLNNTDKVANASAENDWKVSVKKIDLDDNSLAYMVVNKPEIKKTFDADHLDYKHVTLVATDFYYSSAKTEVSINKFTAVDQNKFSITKFETDFSMYQHSITAKNLKVKTTNSHIDADLNIKYTSLASLKDSIQFMIVNADIKNASIKNSDIIYFNPQLSDQPFFKNSMNITTASGVVNGTINNLNGRNLLVHTGATTIIKTDFIISGLPNMEAANFNFPNLEIKSGKADIAILIGSLIPENIDLPDNINMQIVFKGQIKSFESTLKMSSNYGSAHLFATIDKNENFKSKVSITNFDLGRLLKNKAMFGPVSLTAETNGHGLDKSTITAKIKADVSQIYLNKYNYHNLNIDGTISGQGFEGKINLNDENAVVEFDGLVNLNPNQEHYKFNLNLRGADLQKLNFTKDDIRIAMITNADFKGATVKSINGNAEITNIIVAHNEKKYMLDSVLVASINEPNKSELTISSPLINFKYNGTMSPADITAELSGFINNYFPFSDSVLQKKNSDLQNFSFEIQLHNHPILSELLIPQLKEFEPGLIQGSYNGQQNELKINATINKIVYGSTEIRDLAVDINSDVNSLNYNIASSNISNSEIKLDNFLVDGKLADKTIFANVSSIDEKQNKKLLVRSQITMHKANYKIALDPKDFYLMNDRWDVAADNFIEFGKQGFLIHHLFINKTESQVNIASVNDQFNDDLNIAIKNFKLDDFSGIIEKDSSLIKGTIDGNVLLKRINNTYGLIADAKISDLIFREVPIGNLSVKAENPTTEKFNIDANLSGTENNLTATGYYIAKADDNSINFNVAIQSLSLKTIKAFSMGAILEASGNLTGNFLVEGQATAPDITGELVIDNAFITPAALNNRLELKHENVQLKKDGIYFNSFTILDVDRHTAIIDGTVKMKHFEDFNFGLNVNTQDFLLFNTTVKDNTDFYGRMVIDSKISVSGPLELPVVNAKVKMKKGSHFSFAVPEQTLTTDKGEDVVEFVDTLQLNPIMNRENKKEKPGFSLAGFDISSTIEIDKQATLRLLMDPSSTDSLVVKGEAALSFAIDRSGKMSLTGTYNLNEGSYLVSLESVLKRKFDILPGSTIIWNGDLTDADISINASYLVRTSPIDLVADQMSGMSEAEKNSYKQRYEFLVLLKLRGELMHPEINFEIQLPPEDKGILGGAVNAKLNMLNEDQSALNKQVFALLVLGRFIQENPLQAESDGTATAIRTTAGKFLSEQLNKWSSKVVPGVEINFDIQSYDDYKTGVAEGRTQVDIGLKKQLFNERLSVQVGGIVDVEGSKAKQNSASDITSDVTVEYKLTNDGRYRMKGFRHNQYEGAIEGQLVETGIGVLYARDFGKLKELFISPKKSASAKTD